MNTHEFQAKKILEKYGMPIPPFRVISDLSELESVISDLALDQAVIKVQVHAGGRGKAGGVKLAKTPEQIREAAKELLGMKIVNNQTGEEGVVAHKILITALTDYRKEYYMGAVIDRQNARAVLMVSPDGGVDIEEVAEKTPDRILKLPMSLNGTFRNYQLIELVKFMGWSKETAKQGIALAKGLAKAFMDSDASLFEINPLVETEEGDLLVLDAKLSVDDNALYRQKEIASFYDETQIPKNEAMAHEHNLAYVSLEGEVGCMVNGAGLAMATMDMVYHFGGTPANFLDVGGGASKEKVAEGFKIILTDPNVKAILVNIFGGIMNCATLASGIVAAVNELKLQVPLVVRMEGTNVDEGRRILAGSGLNIDIADSMTAAAEKAVAAAKGV
ncbi:ADP-forming succinate--CoA ligase subunit beta [Waddlia chondrophila]|uniref:Succinate--CoA ligase [ADP-forming] subunit beta n=1 Tax=Waddlia chondrophila (strain ATCC VR-1470 / WSU 86-1044) TaxID=716544 RepID=D6YUI5_WADCW|nr:ADP-forming succinate--CoA ligase subunit beta [Waddlia chondrophila]ADI37796.1 Succinyl-CoA synthetase, beta subunit [Waddlia chondrophila WSU 86-1044]